MCIWLKETVGETSISCTKYHVQLCACPFYKEYNQEKSWHRIYLFTIYVMILSWCGYERKLSWSNLQSRKIMAQNLPVHNVCNDTVMVWI
jgi:hypothetical protein